MRRTCLALLAGFAVLSAACADDKKPSTNVESKPGGNDWPQWRGPNRNQLSSEKGLLARWPNGGPKLVWTTKNLGNGYSTPSISAGKIFLMGNRGKDECVIALSEETGTEIWSKTIGKAGSAGGFDGPRGTPTVEGNVLYTLGVNGDLVCLKTDSGEEVWHVSLRKDFKGNVGGWGYCESPLIDGDKLIIAAGASDASIIALNKKNGELIWKSAIPDGDQAHYASAVVAEIGGVRQYVHFLSGGVVGIRASDGKFLWRYDAPHNGTANCSTPIVQNDFVFAASSYGTGGGQVKITGDGDRFTAKQTFFTKSMKNHHGGMVLINGYIYGSNESLLTCLDWKTGKVMWEERKPGKGSIAYADGKLIYRNEGGNGTVFLVEATPKKYVELGKFDQPERSGKSAWPHPVVANGKLYLRDQAVLLCYELRPESQS